MDTQNMYMCQISRYISRKRCGNFEVCAEHVCILRSYFEITSFQCTIEFLRYLPPVIQHSYPGQISECLRDMFYKHVMELPAVAVFRNTVKNGFPVET